jgi:Cu2+-containing amine oxidase
MKSKGLLAAGLVLPALFLVPLPGPGRSQEPAPPDSEKDSTAIFKEMRDLETRQRALIQKLIPDGDTIVMTFPMNPDAEKGGLQTAWKVTWHIDQHKNEVGNINQWFAIKEAYFQTGKGEPWVKVLGDCRVSELFTPYAVGNPRFLDMKQFKFRIIPLTPRHAGNNGRLIGGNKVVAELRDRGLMYSTSGKGGAFTRRGQELVLWAVLEAGNYHFIQQYSFSDDGSVGFRCGSTGANLPNRKTTSHMHNACWRVNVDLGGEGKNDVYVVRHFENKDGNGKADHKEELFNNGNEGFLDWKAEEFTMLRVKHTMAPKDGENGSGRPVAYDLMPFRYGSARHFGSGEGFTQHDFWVTPFNPKEEYYYNVHKYVSKENPRPIRNSRVTLWYMSSAHHEPRQEDGYHMPRANNTWGGVALVMWTGFDLKPRNLFNRTPLYP